MTKGVQCRTQYVSCSSNHEDLAHLIFDCPFAIQIWHMTGIWGAIQHAITSTPSTVETIFLLLDMLSTKHSQQLAALWSLWNYRNLIEWDDFMQQQHVQQPHSVVQSVEENASIGSTTPVAPVSWQCPLLEGISATSMMRSLLVITELELASVYGILRASLCWPKL